MPAILQAMKLKNAIIRIGRFYMEGFRNLTWGRALWLLILVKLFIMFFILRLFFFPDFLASVTEDGEEKNYVSNELIRRAGNPSGNE